MKKVCGTILLVIVLTISASATARENPGDIRFGRITIEQGLSQNSVSCILRDSRGFMWFGTGEGLNKYDGYSFTHYLHIPEDPASISDGQINAICEGRSETLWIGTRQGLNRFDRKSERFAHYRYDSQNAQSLSHDDVRTIFKDKSGTLWIGTGRGLNRFDRDQETFRRYLHNPQNPDSLSHNEVAVIYEDKAGTLWIGTTQGLNRLDPSTETSSAETSSAETSEVLKTSEVFPFKRYLHDPQDPESLSHSSICSIYEDKSGTLWIGTVRGLNRFDRNRETFTRHLTDPQNPGDTSRNRVMGIGEDERGMLWLATRGAGLNILNPRNGRVTRYMHEAQNPKSLSINDLVAIYNDGTGILWIGTFGGGVNKVAYAQKKFAHHSHDPRNPESLSCNDIVFICKGRTGMVWIATFGGGLNRFDPENKTFSNYRHDPENPASLSADIVLSVHQDSNGILWLGTMTGLNRFDPKDQTVVRYQHDEQNPGSLSHNWVSDVWEDREKNLWIGTGKHGLDLFDRETGIFTHFPHDEENPRSLSHNRIRAIYEDSAGTLWAGTDKGLNRFVRETGNFQRYFHDPENPESLSNDKIRYIYEDRAENLWIGTSRGLNKFDRNTETFTRYTKRHGLPNNMIYCISEDDLGNIWVSTNRGLSRFDPRNGMFKNYSADDGLQSNEFNTGACCRTRNGEMIFGGINGFNTFDPENMPENPHIPPVRITAFQKFNRDVKLETHISEVREMMLSHRDYVFSFEFAALDYTAPDKNMYAYMLEGFEEDWNYTDAKRRFATYTNLRGGAYTFRVRGSNNDGVWNEEGTSLKIIITPPWWESWWFRGFMLILMICLISGGFRWRVRTIKSQKRRLEIQVNERTHELGEAKEAAEAANQAKSTFLANMSHELRTPLNGILGYAQILRRDRHVTAIQTDGLDIISKSGEHLLTLINDILDMAKVEAGKLELFPAPVALSDFLDGVASIMRMAAHQKDIKFVFDAPDDLPAAVDADEKRLRQVLLNLLGNAVKFTDEGSVTLRVESRLSDKNRVSLRFEIRDTGVGMTPQELAVIFRPFEQAGDAKKRAEGTGLGLTITRQLVRLMGGEIHAESEYGRGSVFQFEIALPVRREEVSGLQTAKTQQVTGYQSETGGERRKILIVDDVEENRLMLLSLLEPLGFDITLAEDGKEGIEQAKAVRPDLILMDLVMPVMTGFEAIQEIRRMPEFRETPIIAVSASVIKTDRERSRIAGCDAFLPKPVRAEKLFTLMEKLMGLEWIYEERELEMADEKSGPVPDDADIIPPPPEELDILYELARFGSMNRIQEQAVHLEELDEKYAPFARKLRLLARNFEDEQIVTLVKQFMDM